MSQVSYPADAHKVNYAAEENSFWFNHRKECILALIERFPYSGTLYDIGGGNGQIALALKQKGREAVLVEPGPDGARHGRERGLQVIQSDFEKLDIQPNSIGAAGLFDVVEHLENADSLLKKIKSSLSKNGRLYLTVPAYNFLWSSEDVSAGHFRRYRRKTIHEALGAAGFSIAYSTYFFSLLPLPIFLLRTLPSAIGLRRSGGGEAYAHEIEKPAPALLQWSLKKELAAIRAGKQVPFGSSILISAKAD